MRERPSSNRVTGSCSLACALPGGLVSNEVTGNLARPLRGVLYETNIPNLSSMSDAVRLNPKVIIGSDSLDLQNEKLLRFDAARF